VAFTENVLVNQNLRERERSDVINCIGGVTGW